MDLLLIARTIWRYKLATLPVIVLTLCGVVYAVAVKDPVYEAKSSYVLINPPAPPTPDEVAHDPALGRVNADNPYTRFTDPSVVIQVLTGALNSESARRALEDAGADSRYTVAPSAEPGYFTSPIVYITGVGATRGTPCIRPRWSAMRSSASSTGCRRYGASTRNTQSRPTRWSPPPAPSCGHRARSGRWSPCWRWARCCFSWSSRWRTP